MLTEAEYRQAKKCQSALEQKIAQAEAEEKDLETRANNIHATKLALDAELKLYTNFMSEAFKEYEEAHPTEID